MGARADLCREWLAQQKEIAQLKAEADKWCSAADDIQKKLMKSMKNEAQLRELVKEATKMDWTWSITQNKKWLAKAEKLMEGK
jgi:hypothetical protein